MSDIKKKTISELHPMQPRQSGLPQSRRILFLLIASLVCVACLSQTVFAATYYVDAINGDDLNDGSQSTQGAGTIGPWRTIERARNVKGGYMAMPGPTYEITVTKGNATEFQIGEYITTADPARAWLGSYIDGKMVIHRASGDLSTISGTITGTTTGATATVTGGHALITYSPEVDDGDTVYFADGTYDTYWEDARDWSNYFFYNRGDWITYKAEIGQTAVKIKNIKIYNYKSGQSPPNGISYLRFDGFEILDGAYLYKTSNLQFLNCDVTRLPLSYTGYYAPYHGEVDKAFSLREITNLLIDNCTFHDTGRGISGGVAISNVTITNCLFHTLSDDGISGLMSNLVVDHCTIYDQNKFPGPQTIIGTMSGSFTPGETLTTSGGESQARKACTTKC